MLLSFPPPYTSQKFLPLLPLHQVDDHTAMWHVRSAPCLLNFFQD